ncbi:hypothetical protein T265_01753 [Opisthorchis viverrini]|uniref:Uncharacterized protein n=1 Tax=Opisthorchis viverrini TaxID=6198 RepID=A0A075AIS3_OPIVI|nr:hypothetical protein T265_01753 [Opisthorchis viverrini]KER32134.1 hypothetical protein T265_01753 [Opisthorchis viverrini]
MQAPNYSGPNAVRCSMLVVRRTLVVRGLRWSENLTGPELVILEQGNNAMVPNAARGSVEFHVDSSDMKPEVHNSRSICSKPPKHWPYRENAGSTYELLTYRWCNFGSSLLHNIVTSGVLGRHKEVIVRKLLSTAQTKEDTIGPTGQRNRKAYNQVIRNLEKNAQDRGVFSSGVKRKPNHAEELFTLFKMG